MEGRFGRPRAPEVIFPHGGPQQPNIRVVEGSFGRLRAPEVISPYERHSRWTAILTKFCIMQVSDVMKVSKLLLQKLLAT